MLKIPTKFKKILEKNENLFGIVMKTSADISDLVKNSEFEFFPDYTDHRLEHLNRVLETCEFLIDDESYNLLTPEDITVLVMSVLLHDIGMHITHEGLLSLIDGDLKSQKVTEFDSLNWDESWDLFLREAKRLNEKELRNLYGSNNPVKEPPKDKDLLTRNDNKLFGEFLRRNHPRLAHEIALNGFPSKDGKTIPFGIDLDWDLKDLIGLVARSHGMNLRSTFDYLMKKYKMVWVSPRNVKVVFLMVVLRVADYLHITSERAPSISLNTKNISSAISQQEWNLHRSVKEISNNLADSESIYVVAEPSSSQIFLKMQKLLNGIQYELDTSWGVLGEVYSSISKYKDLKIKIRRIQSNIDELEEFSKSVEYIPKKITCECDSELLKLLISPLYGDNPTYGVRELMQNALDACKERKFILDKKNLNTGYIPNITIEIQEEDNKMFFVIKDNGIGMDEDIIINYFLKAGASFRNSLKWKNEFTDSNSKSNVQRSGRFGVGVFAGFLIGQTMEVTTRHINSTTAFNFKVNVDQEQIEVVKCSGEIGTTIKIQIGEDAIIQLKDDLSDANSYSRQKWYDWFRLSEPEMKFSLPESWGNFSNRLDSIRYINVKENELNLSNTIFVKEYEDIKWSYNYLYPYNSSAYGDMINLVCNGIIIPEGYKLRKLFSFPKFQRFNEPTLLISDFNGNLPLTLRRNELSQELPFAKELVQDICKDIIANLLVIPVLQFESTGHFTILNHKSEHPSLMEGLYDSTTPIMEFDLVLYKAGFCLFHSYNIERLKIKKVSKIWSDSIEKNFLNHENDLQGIIFSDSKISSIQDYKRLLEAKKIGNDEDYNVKSMRIIINKDKYKYLLEKGRLGATFRRDASIEREGDNILSITLGQPSEPIYDFERFEEHHNEFTLYIEYDFSKEDEQIPNEEVLKESNQLNISSEVFKKVLGQDVLIPYNDRDSKMEIAYKLLREYIEKQ